MISRSMSFVYLAHSVPDKNGVVRAPGDQPAQRRHHQREHRAPVTPEHVERRATTEAPLPDGPVVAPRPQPLAVGRRGEHAPGSGKKEREEKKNEQG